MSLHFYTLFAESGTMPLLASIFLGSLILSTISGWLMALALFWLFEQSKPVPAWVKFVLALIPGLVHFAGISLFGNLGFGLFMGGIAGISWVLGAAKYDHDFRYEKEIALADAIRWSWKNYVVGMGMWLLLWLVFHWFIPAGVAFVEPKFAFLFAGIFAFRGDKIDSRSFPNQSTWLSLRNGGIAGILLGVATFISGIFQEDGYGGVLVSLGVFAGIFGVYGGVNGIKHGTLRLLLKWKHNVPWAYPQFLDHIGDYTFLRRVGGGYMFRHQLLQQFFADETP